MPNDQEYPKIIWVPPNRSKGKLRKFFAGLAAVVITALMVIALNELSVWAAHLH